MAPQGLMLLQADTGASGQGRAAALKTSGCPPAPGPVHQSGKGVHGTGNLKTPVLACM